MRVAIASDHAGFEMKNAMKPRIEKLGVEIVDLGAFEYLPQDDYPDYAFAVGEAVARGEAKRGILICGSGVGVSVAANKVRGVRACLCHDTYSAHQGVEHDDMNVLVIGARVIGIELADELVTTFLRAKFSGEERHQRRLEKVIAAEARFGEQK
jgi:ribose 5-phosphate isomerase B